MSLMECIYLLNCRLFKWSFTIIRLYRRLFLRVFQNISIKAAMKLFPQIHYIRDFTKGQWYILDNLGTNSLEKVIYVNLFLNDPGRPYTYVLLFPFWKINIYYFYMSSSWAKLHELFLFIAAKKFHVYTDFTG